MGRDPGGEPDAHAGLRFSALPPTTLVMEFYERRLPHWHPTGKDIFLTWRLYGTLPPNRFPPDGPKQRPSLRMGRSLPRQRSLAAGWRPHIAASPMWANAPSKWSGY